MSVQTFRDQPQRITTTRVLEWNDGEERRVFDDLSGEEPLEIRVGASVATVTMRTPGDDDELAAGFLFSEGIIDGRSHLSRISHRGGPSGCGSGNVVDVTLSRRPGIDLSTLQRNVVSGSACGLCGRTSIEAIRSREMPRPNPDFRIAPEVLTRMPAALRTAQQVFGRTGGLHAAGLFDADGALLLVREDIGRHNAVDKAIGASLLQDEVPWSERVLLVSGRGGSEIVQKALVVGLPILVSVSAPSSLAVRLARDGGLTLIGFLRDRRFVVYSHPDRIAGASAETLR